jgi:hypothetical protein
MLRVVHSSTRNAFTSLSSQRSSILSLRCHGLSDRQNVASRIFVPIVPYIALGTCPFSDTERKRLYNVSTIKAPLSGRKEPVYLHQRLSVPGGFVFQHPSEYSKAGITDRMRKATVSDHSAYVQVFNNDEVKPSHQVSGDLMKVIIPCIRNEFLQFRYCKASSFPSATAFLPSAHDALQSSQLPIRSLKVLWVRYSLASGQSGETMNAKVDADRSIGFRKMLNSFIEHQGDVVPSSRRLGYRDRGRTTGELARPSHFQFAKLRYGKSTIAELECANGIFRRLLLPLFLESGVCGALLKECLKGGLQMAQSLLRGHRGDLLQPFRFGSMTNLGEDRGRTNVIIRSPLA